MYSKHQNHADVRQALSSNEVIRQEDDLDLDTFPWIDWPF
jgi:hypothetical protein